jgi:DNA-directed RNA polymerase subunit RPC12/RpoP
MALIQCSECHKQISDRAAACPHCGAPVLLAPRPTPAADATARPSKKKTHPATWVVLVLIVIMFAWYLPKAQHDANLPPMPVDVKTRTALTGPGLVLQVKNVSTRHLTFLVTLKNPTTNQEKSYRLDAAPSGTVEVGYKEGWTVASGDQLKIANNDYKVWEGSVP